MVRLQLGREPLPIDPYLPQIKAAVEAHPLVVVRAEPGSGKTTRLPPALLALAGEKSVLVVEPRRIAALNAAARVATEAGERVGSTVGYRVRHEQRGGPTTRLWYATDGLVMRDLMRDPFLEGVAILVLDEFHERRAATDLLFAIARFLQRSLRPELRVVILSATIQVRSFQSAFPDCAVVDCPGRCFPVRTLYSGAPRASLGASIAAAVEVAFAQPEHTGDTLVFLPGMREIRQAEGHLRPWVQARGLELLHLHGSQPLSEQQRIFTVGQRRIVLATNVAESSITVPGVTAVVDSGLAREAYFDRRRGLNTLRLMRISQASAEQRRGRAGRTAAGVCVRLGTAAEFEHRRPQTAPEILRVDLADLLLQVAAWGLEEPQNLPWLDPPPASGVEAARALLRRLGAVDDRGRITDLGRRLARLPVEVRLARWLEAACEQGCAEDVALLAALWSEAGPGFAGRQEAGPAGSAGSDLWAWAQAYCLFLGRESSPRSRGSASLPAFQVQRIERTRRELLRLLGVPPAAPTCPPADSLAFATLLLAYPDRLCRTRKDDPERGLMVGGHGVRLRSASVVRRADWFLALDVEWPASGARREGLVRVASAVAWEWIERFLADATVRASRLYFDGAERRVLEEEQLRVFDLVAWSATRPAPPGPQTAAVLCAALRNQAGGALRLTRADRELAHRLSFLARLGWAEFAAWHEPSAVWVMVLEEAAQRCTSVDELAQVDAGAVLRRCLTAPLLPILEREAPSHLRLPEGRMAPLEYGEGSGPVLSLRVQEAFGWAETPRIGTRKIPVTLRLLAPNGRPVQITSDLASFWKHGYAEVRRQLRGRYPKHAWPEDPCDASLAARPASGKV